MTPSWQGGPLMFPVKEATIVSRAVSMRQACERVGSRPMFIIRDEDKIHPVWATDWLGHAFSDAHSAEDVARVRASLRALYRSSRPVLDVFADEGFWPAATHVVRLERREVLHFHPATRNFPVRYVQTFATVSLCESGKHVRGSFDGDVCPTGLAWNADEPI